MSNFRLKFLISRHSNLSKLKFSQSPEIPKITGFSHFLDKKIRAEFALKFGRPL